MIYSLITSQAQKDKSKLAYIIAQNKSQKSKRQQQQQEILSPKKKLHTWIDQNIKHQGFNYVKKSNNQYKFVRTQQHKQRKLYTPGQRINMELMQHAYQLPDTSHKLSHPNQSKILPGQNITQQLLWQQKILYDIKQSRFLENHPEIIQQQKKQFQERKLKRKQLEQQRVQKLKEEAERRKLIYSQEKTNKDEELKLDLQKINNFAWKKRQKKYDLDKYKAVKSQRSKISIAQNNQNQNIQQDQKNQSQKPKINHQEQLNKIESALWKNVKSPKNYDYDQYVKQTSPKIEYQIKIKKFQPKEQTNKIQKTDIHKIQATLWKQKIKKPLNIKDYQRVYNNKVQLENEQKSIKSQTMNMNAKNIKVDQPRQKVLPSQTILWGNKNQNKFKAKINYGNYRSQNASLSNQPKQQKNQHIYQKESIEHKPKQKKQINDQIIWGNKKKPQSAKNYELYRVEKKTQQEINIQKNQQLKVMKKSTNSDQNNNRNFISQPPNKQILWQKKYLEKQQETNINSYKRKSMEKRIQIQNQKIINQIKPTYQQLKKQDKVNHEQQLEKINNKLDQKIKSKKNLNYNEYIKKIDKKNEEINKWQPKKQVQIKKIDIKQVQQKLNINNNKKEKINIQQYQRKNQNLNENISKNERKVYDYSKYRDQKYKLSSPPKQQTLWPQQKKNKQSTNYQEHRSGNQILDIKNHDKLISQNINFKKSPEKKDYEQVKTKTQIVQQKDLYPNNKLKTSQNLQKYRQKSIQKSNQIQKQLKQSVQIETKKNINQKNLQEKNQINRKLNQKEIQIKSNKPLYQNKSQNIIQQTNNNINFNKIKNIPKKESFLSQSKTQKNQNQKSHIQKQFSSQRRDQDDTIEKLNFIKSQKFQSKKNLSKKNDLINHYRVKTQQKIEFFNTLQRKDESSKIEGSTIWSPSLKSKNQNIILTQKSELILNKNKQQLPQNIKTYKKLTFQETNKPINEDLKTEEIKRSKIIINMINRIYKNKITSAFKKINENGIITSKKNILYGKLLTLSMFNLLKNAMKKNKRQAFIKIKRNFINQEIKLQKTDNIIKQKNQIMSKQILCFQLSKIIKQKQAFVFQKLKSLKYSQEFRLKGIQIFSLLFLRKLRQSFEFIKSKSARIKKEKVSILNRIAVIVHSFEQRKMKLIFSKIISCNLNPLLSSRSFIKKKMSNTSSLQRVNNLSQSKQSNNESNTQKTQKLSYNQENQKLKLQQLQKNIKQSKNQFIKKKNDLEKKLSFLRKSHQSCQKQIKLQDQKNKKLKIQCNINKQQKQNQQNENIQNTDQYKKKVLQLGRIYLTFQQEKQQIDTQINIKNFIQKYKLSLNLKQNSRFFDQQQLFQLNCKLRTKISKIQGNKNEEILKIKLIKESQQLMKMIKGYIIQIYAWQNIKLNIQQKQQQAS